MFEDWEGPHELVLHISEIALNIKIYFFYKYLNAVFF